jgi:hypothetical protein
MKRERISRDSTRFGTFDRSYGDHIGEIARYSGRRCRVYMNKGGNMNGKTTILRRILVMTTVFILMTIVTTSAAEATQDSTGITWNFETGDLSGWTKTGTAFDYQPTYGDNPFS